MNMLIIEDSPDVVEAVSLCLQLRWPEVTLSTAYEGIKGIERLKSGSFDAVILDINLPDIDGFEVLKQIRSFSNVPVVILTVRGEEDDQVRGLEMGADDYIVKPFRPREIIARLNSVLRRADFSEGGGVNPSIARDNLILHPTTNEARIGDQIIKLTPSEQKLLYILMKYHGHTLDNEILLKEMGEKDDNAQVIRTYIRRLRKKLSDNPPQMILSERGKGYRFVGSS